MVWMDVCEAEQAPQKRGGEETVRPPLVPSEKNNVVARKPRITREVPSRYKAAITSPSLSTPAVSRRCPSPNATRSVPTSPPPFPKRAQSAERRRPSTPPSPSRPSTPVYDTSADIQNLSRRLAGGRTSEGLWPSTMRSLSVSFQSDTFSLPISKKEKPVTHASSDHVLKPAVSVAHRQAETPIGRQKATPERKRTPLRGRNASDHLENSKPMDNSHARVVWPGRTGGKVSASSLTRSMDFTEKISKSASLPLQGRGVSPLRRPPSSDGMGRGEQQSQSETQSRVSSNQRRKVEYEMYAVDDTLLRSSEPRKFVSLNVGISSSLSERASTTLRASRSQSLPIPGPSRPPSPGKVPSPSPTPSRGMLSPSRTRQSNPFSSVSSLTNRSSSSSSVLSFITDVRKGKKGVNHIEDVHQLRLLYNRYLQWRYANARAEAALSIQKITAENTLCNVWNTTSELWHSVIMKRINLQQLIQELKLNSVLNEQMAYLDDWTLLEREHSISLSEATEALEACTLRLPVNAGARVDIHTLKNAICSATDVMQATGSSICSLLSRVEGINCPMSELAVVTAQERALFDECRDLLASTAAMQVEENSLRTHLIQLKQTLRNGEQQSISAIEIPV